MSVSSMILPKDELFKLYFVDRQTILKCSKYFNVNARTIRNNFRLNGWKFRTHSEVSIGRQFSETTKKKMSLANSGRRFSDEINLKKGRPGHIGANKGKTKENSESIRRMALKLEGRNKFNYLPLKLLSEKRSKENKLNCNRVKKQAESHFVKSTIECKNFLEETLKNCNKTNFRYLFYLAQRCGFRNKDIERSFKILKKENEILIKNKVQSRKIFETKLEEQTIVPFLKNKFPDFELKKQVKIKTQTGKRYILDLVLYKNLQPFLIIESKIFITRKLNKEEKQLKNYAEATNIKKLLLTNGFRYLWYFYDKNELKLIHDGINMPDFDQLEEKSCSILYQIQ